MPHDAPRESRRLVVMESFTALRPTSNPYQTQLVAALEPLVTVVMFSWRRALAGDFDVLHLHWPEVLVRDRRRARTLARRLVFLLVLVRIRLTRRAIVRTVHNIAPHESGPRGERTLLRLCDRWTAGWILLNQFTPPQVRAGRAARAVVLHGHYRDWFAGTPTPELEFGHLAYVGRIRAYKGVETLIGAFAELADPRARLTVAGSPETPDAAARIERAAAADARVTAELRHVSDAELAAIVGRSELVVLPYRDMHNSGVALLALSLDRPILVPDNEVNRALADEVGAPWVQLFGGSLDAATLEAAQRAVRERASGAAPDLSERDWKPAAIAHVQVFRAALDLRRRRRS